MKLNEELQQLYLELAEFVNEYNDMASLEERLTICPAIIGSENADIMVIGRAINGWCEWMENDCKEIIDRLNRCSNITLDWVRGENYFTYCKNEECPYAKQKNGEKSKSVFWRFARRIVDPQKENQNWTHNIVWTNLYKASFKEGGNPKGLYNKLKNYCDKILVAEIRYFNPKKIYFITESNSSKSDKPYWLSKADFPRTFQYLLEKKDIEIYVSKRPEMRKFDELLVEMTNLETHKKIFDIN